MKVVFKEVGKAGVFKDIEGTLEEFQTMCGGWIETFPIPQDMVLLINEEGKLMGLEPNIIIQNGYHEDVLVGNIVVVSIRPHDGEFHSLDEKQIELLKTTPIFEDSYEI